MSLKSFVKTGLAAMAPSDRKIRSAIVGLGDIAHASSRPGIDHTGNSEVNAFVAGDKLAARCICRDGLACEYSRPLSREADGCLSTSF